MCVRKAEEAKELLIKAGESISDIETEGDDSEEDKYSWKREKILRKAYEEANKTLDHPNQVMTMEIVWDLMKLKVRTTMMAKSVGTNVSRQATPTVTPTY